MDIRTVETVSTSGGLKDPVYRVTPGVETTSLTWDADAGNLSLVDHNLNYSILPGQLGTDIVKKTFLTYNGKSCPTGKLLETVIIESGNGPDINQIPGFNNSNEWIYNPSTYTMPNGIQDFTDIDQYQTADYIHSHGYTIVKNYLSVGSMLTPGTSTYTAFHHAPHYFAVTPANLVGSKIYTDGWYTSYVCAVKTWLYTNPPVNGASKGDIVYWPAKEEFYINITGVGGTIQVPTSGPDLTPRPDDTNWKASPSFDEWQDLMKTNLGQAMVDDPIWFIESQHLVTIGINKAIRSELLKDCNECESGAFRQSKISMYIKLMQKRLGAWTQFNSGMFHDASNILISARDVCDLVMKECNSGGKC